MEHSNLKRFELAVNLQTSQESERKRFVYRIESEIFNSEDFRDGYMLFREVCFELGADFKQLCDDYTKTNTDISVYRRYHPSFKALTNGNFIDTIRVLIAIYDHLHDKPKLQQVIDSVVAQCIDMSLVDLGIRWHEGVAFPSGVEELDEALIQSAFKFLVAYPNIQDDLHQALGHYGSGNYTGVVAQCYLAIEGLVRDVMGNKKTLDKNCRDLHDLLELDSNWKQIIQQYIRFAHDFRHASNTRYDISVNEIEAQLYMTCLLIRLIVQSVNRRSKLR